MNILFIDQQNAFPFSKSHSTRRSRRGILPQSVPRYLRITCQRRKFNNTRLFSSYLHITNHHHLQLKSRMQVIQHELQRLSEMISYNDDDVKKFSHFKSEFNHIFKELRRRKSVKVRRPSVITQVNSSSMNHFTRLCQCSCCVYIHRRTKTSHQFVHRGKTSKRYYFHSRTIYAKKPYALLTKPIKNQGSNKP